MATEPHGPTSGFGPPIVARTLIGSWNPSPLEPEDWRALGDLEDPIGDIVCLEHYWGQQI